MANAAPAFGAYKRTGNAELAARNCYAEQYPSASGPALQMRCRPGLGTFKTVGSGPLRAGHQKDGLFDNAALVVSRTTLYSLTASGIATAYTGTIAGDGLLDVDSGQDNDLNSIARIATGDALYLVSGGNVTLEDFPEAGGAGATSVCEIRSYWLAVEAGTDKVYYQIPGDLTWQALSFASAEFQPDKLVAVRKRGDQIALLGSSTFEAWTLSGDATNPIVPYGGLAFNIGCRSRPAAIPCGDSLVFVDAACNVRRWDGGTLNIVSDAGLAEQISSVSADDLKAWTFSIPGHRFYVLTLGSVATWVYDLDGNGERWTTFDSLGYDYWRAGLGFSIGQQPYALDNITSAVYMLDPLLRTDAGVQFGVEFSFTIDGADMAVPLSNLVVICDVGDAPRTGQGSAPIISLKLSGNQGKTFSAWRDRPFNITGDFDSVPRWTGLGDIPAFYGIVGRVRVADPVGRIFKQVRVNVP